MKTVSVHRIVINMRVKNVQNYLVTLVFITKILLKHVARPYFLKCESAVRGWHYYYTSFMHNTYFARMMKKPGKKPDKNP